MQPNLNGLRDPQFVNTIKVEFMTFTFIIIVIALLPIFSLLFISYVCHIEDEQVFIKKTEKMREITRQYEEKIKKLYETDYLNSNPANAKHLNSSIKELRSGK